MIPAALVQGHHVAAQAGLVLRLLLDLGHDRPTRLDGFLGVGRCRHRGIHAGGDILDGLQDVQFEIHALDLLGQGPGHEAVAQIVLLLGAELLQRVGADVMVRDDQAVLAHERARPAAVEADARFHQVIEPGIGHFEAVLVQNLAPGRIGEQPHAFLGVRRKRGGGEGEDTGEDGRKSQVQMHKGRRWPRGACPASARSAPGGALRALSCLRRARTVSAAAAPRRELRAARWAG
jgi:hypothetical protein